MDRGTATKLKNAVAWIRGGKTAKARQLLVELLRGEPENAQAWYLLSYALDDKQRKQYALLQAIQKDPEFKLARERLAQLRGEQRDEPQAATTPIAPEISRLEPTPEPLAPPPIQEQAYVENAERGKRGVGLGTALRLIIFGLFALIITFSAFAAYQIYLPKAAVVPTPTATLSPTASPFPTRTSTPTVPPTPEVSIAPIEVITLSPAEQAVIDTIELQVSELRGLTPQHDVSVGMMPENEIILLLADLYFSEQKALELQQNEMTLRALGLLAEADHLTDYELFRNADSLGGVLGFGQGQIYLAGESLGGVLPLAAARLFDQTLIAQAHPEAFSQTQDCAILSDKCRALSALVMGDAALLGSQWLAAFASDETKLAIDEFASAEADGAGQSGFVEQELAFPAQSGQEFVQSIFGGGGWPQVDAVYGNPPASSEQVLHPTKYAAGEAPMVVDDPSFSAAFGSGWSPLGEGELGEWLTYLVLSHGALVEARQPENAGEVAAAGWGGDAIQAYVRVSDGAVALAVHWVMDSASDAGELGSAMRSQLAARFGEEASPLGAGACWADVRQRSCLFVNGSEVLWLLGPDEIVVLQVMLTHFHQFQ